MLRRLFFVILFVLFHSSNVYGFDTEQISSKRGTLHLKQAPKKDEDPLVNALTMIIKDQRTAHQDLKKDYETAMAREALFIQYALARDQELKELRALLLSNSFRQFNAHAPSPKPLLAQEVTPPSNKSERDVRTPSPAPVEADEIASVTSTTSSSGSGSESGSRNSSQPSSPTVSPGPQRKKARPTSAQSTSGSNSGSGYQTPQKSKGVKPVKNNKTDEKARLDALARRAKASQYGKVASSLSRTGSPLPSPTSSLSRTGSPLSSPTQKPNKTDEARRVEAHRLKPSTPRYGIKTIARWKPTFEKESFCRLNKRDLYVHSHLWRHHKLLLRDKS